MSIPEMEGKMEFSEVVHRTAQSFRASAHAGVGPKGMPLVEPPVEKYRETITFCSPVQGQLLMHIVP